jgi:hypothetical protein
VQHALLRPQVQRLTRQPTPSVITTITIIIIISSSSTRPGRGKSKHREGWSQRQSCARHKDTAAPVISERSKSYGLSIRHFAIYVYICIYRRSEWCTWSRRRSRRWRPCPCAAASTPGPGTHTTHTHT